MKRFFTYEEYGAHWTTMSQDLTTSCKGLNGWQEYERGVEALSKVVASENNRLSSSRKALTFPDLLIKVFWKSTLLISHLLTFLCSQFRGCANTRFFSTTYVVIPQSAMIPKHMPKSRRRCSDCRRRYAKSIKQRMTLRLGA